MVEKGDEGEKKRVCKKNRGRCGRDKMCERRRVREEAAEVMRQAREIAAGFRGLRAGRYRRMLSIPTEAFRTPRK